nr:helix-turn-helix transcriptional regulator [Paenibacillus alvei]
MLQKNIKMVHIARELGVSVTYISEIFKGTRKGEKQRPAIAKMLGMESEILK